MGFFENQVITANPVGGIKTHIIPTKAKEVITFSGSFNGGANYSGNINPKISSITAAMVDKGTTNRSKYDISEVLDSVGAEIKFGSTQHHTFFTTHCLKDNIPMVIDVLSDEFKNPVFEHNELEKLKTRLLGQIEQSREDTKKQAHILFTQKIYPKNHLNYQFQTDETIDFINSITKDDLISFHNKAYGLGSMNIAVAGDVDDQLFNDQINKAFNNCGSQNLSQIEKTLKANESIPIDESVNIKDKTSADIYIGQSIGIDEEHEDYYALMMGVYILGGNFSARLMQTVRDEQGLTYGIGSSISGLKFGLDGYWTTWGTFAPQLIDKGKEATLEQIQIWYNNGITKDELEAKKSTITGTFKVSLDTTGGLVNQILSNVERSKEIKHLDQYPEIINNLKLDQVNNAIGKYIDPKKLTIVSAGSFNNK